MKLKLTLSIVVSALAFTGVAAQARPIHHFAHHHYARYARYTGHARPQISTGAAPAADGLRGLVARTAAQNGVPYRLANAVVTIESQYRPHVSNGTALGLMQIKAQTARGLGFTGSPSSLFDPDVNVRYGMAYLAQAYRQAGGDLCGTVMRYNSGLGATHMSAGNRVYCSRAEALMARI